MCYKNVDKLNIWSLFKENGANSYSEKLFC